MSTLPPRASILAVGTEITTGQITNRNATWISEKLTNIGIQVVLHETVADDRKAILKAIEHCIQNSQFLFITGGLGPTTDDFTREVIAQWAQKPLGFFEPSWNRITERLTRLGIPIAQSNRQQCLFPAEAEILPNPRGTADAFKLENQGAHVWALPGPPAEITAIWESSKIEEKLQALCPALERTRLFTWQCLGKSEAELGEITEATLRDSGLQTGYRAHRPYIEVKVWCPESRLSEAEPHLTRLEKTLAPWNVGKHPDDLVRRFLKALLPYEEIQILDAATGGALGERLGRFLRDPEFSQLTRSLILATEWYTPLTSPVTPKEWLEKTLQQSDAESLTLAVCGINETGDWSIGLRFQKTTYQSDLKTPYPKNTSPEMKERSQRYVTEKAMSQWGLWLEQSIQ